MIETKKLSRRQFLSGMARLGGAASALLIHGSSHAQSSPPRPPSNLRLAGTTTRSILGQNDFTYRGYYVVWSPDPVPTSFAQGFTHRYVGGQVRFLWLAYAGPGIGHYLLECSLPSNYGETVPITNQWNDIWNGTYSADAGKWIGLWWDEPPQRLWTTSAIDYPDNTEAASTKTIFTRTLNANGTVSNLRGQIGLQGIGARRIYGGAQAVPAWFQSQYGVGPYVVGWGGYTSRMTQDLTSSLGPTMYAIPDPAGFGNNTDISTSQFKTIMDCSLATPIVDWYANGHPTAFDRGVRNTNVNNTYEAPNWQSPAPDGLGRWTWGDSSYNTGCWIDGPNKHGFLLVPSFSSGRAWYETSTLHCESRTFEIQVFDPSRFGEAISGTRPVWDVKPTARWEISLPGLGDGTEGNGPYHNVAGASFDSTTKRLYLFGVYSSDYSNRIYVYDVNC